MRKLRNPYAASDRPEFQCFACSPYNTIGLQMQFWDDGKDVIAKWMPRKSLEGYTNVLHGGIQATLLDELASWVVQTRCKTVGVTYSMEITYRRPVLISAGEITLRGRVQEEESSVAIIETELLGNDGKLYATAILKFFLFDTEKAITEYFYPGADAFYEDED